LDPYEIVAQTNKRNITKNLYLEWNIAQAETVQESPLAIIDIEDESTDQRDVDVLLCNVTWNFGLSQCL